MLLSKARAVFAFVRGRFKAFFAHPLVNYNKRTTLFVTGSRRNVRLLYALSFWGFITAVLANQVVHLVEDGGWLVFLCALWSGGWMGMAAMKAPRAANAYRTGYWEGHLDAYKRIHAMHVTAFDGDEHFWRMAREYESDNGSNEEQRNED